MSLFSILGPDYEVGNIGLEEHKSLDVFSTEASSEHVSPAVPV